MDAPPRTRHWVDGRPRYTNALAQSTSPYLRQHAHNPVNWQPWGEAAFAEARRRGVPVFLSVGYATCHWCHVMEHESFEDEEVATLLNTLYVPVKVDREERPDIDAVYMDFVQLTTGQGGWPMTVWLSPEKRPLYGGTYFPARSGDRGQQTGLVELLPGLAQIWRDRKFQAQAEPALEALAKVEPPAATLPGPVVHALAQRIFSAGFDPRHGGFTRAPKFPRPPVLSWMLRQARTEPTARTMVETTLEAMYCGGVYDHVAGGFARYAVDARWRVPHFEKTLYDNAQLAQVYLEAWQLTGRPLWRQVATEVLDYLARELCDAGGGFWSGTDADSADAEGHLHEGRFFTWTPDELVAALGPEEGGWVVSAFGITEAGDFEGRGVLHLVLPLGPEAAETWARIRPRLHAARATRPAPAVDDKVVTAWNGLAISAFARAAGAFGMPAYLDRARAAARFALETLRTPEGRLHRTAWRGQAGHPAVLEDYAALVLGLLDLTEATGEAQWLQAARALFAVVERDYADPAGGWFRTAVDGEPLLFREKPDQDGVEPSGTTLATRAALRLAVLTEGEATGGHRFRVQAEAGVRSVGSVLERAPHAVPGLLSALHDLQQPRLLVVVTPDDAPPTALLEAAWSRYLPEMAVVFGRADGELAARLPAFAHRPALGGRPTAYHCRGTACDLPATDRAALEALLT